jgi:hypothetical protein
MQHNTKILSLVLLALIVISSTIYFKYDVHSKFFSKDSAIATSTKTVLEKPDIDKIVDTEVKVTPPVKKQYKYIETVGSCGPHYDGVCINVRTGPGTQYPSKLKLRNGIVLQVDENPVNTEGRDWYKIKFDEYLFFPERVDSDLYVASEFVNAFYNEGNKSLEDAVFPNIKTIIIDLSEQTLYAYEGEDLFMKQLVSTGLDKTPTRVGEFKIFKKTPSRYMQGADDGPEDQFYDLPGVPWDLYFTYDGNVIHGAYWHNNFGQKWSHGCVNLPYEKSKELYLWADVGTTVIVQE